MYKILELHSVIIDQETTFIAALWDDNGLSRATALTFKGKSLAITPSFLQDVAANGQYLDERYKKRFFPTVQNWSR